MSDSNNKSKEESMTGQGNAKTIGHYFSWAFFVVFIICILSIVYFFQQYSTTQQKTLSEIRKEIQHNKEIAVFIDKNGSIVKSNMSLYDDTLESQDALKISEVVNIPLEILKEVKSFNEALNEKQNETLQLVVVIIAFFSIIATFFGYKTIRDIKDAAIDEEQKLTKRYENIFNHLENITFVTKKLSDEVYTRSKEDIEEDKKELQILKEQFENLKKDTEEKINELENSFKKTMEEKEKDFKNTKDKYKGMATEEQGGTND